MKVERYVSSCVTDGAHRVTDQSGRRPSSLRGHLRRRFDSERCGLPQRMRFKIGQREQRQVGGSDRTAERLLIASGWIRRDFKADPVSVRTGHLRRMLEAPIELLRSRRLTEIESLRAHVNSNCDLATGSRNSTGEERAGNGGGTEDKPGTHECCLGVHVNLLEDSS